MIVTITLNPAIDRTINLNTPITIGQKNRGVSSYVEPGGSGIHASRAIKSLGGESIALGISAGSNGRFLKDTITSMDILHDFIDVPGQTRVNLHIYEPNGVRTDFHEPGYKVSDGDFLRFLERVNLYLDKNTYFILGGSVPRNLSDQNVNMLYKTITDAGCSLIIESEGTALISSLPYNPEWVVCDKWRLAEVCGFDINSPEDALKGASELIEKGAKAVCISLYEKGTLMISQDHEPVFATVRNSSPFEHTIALLDGVTGALAIALSKKFSFDETAKFVYAMGHASSKLTGTGMDSLLSVFHTTQEVVLYTF